MMYVRFVAGDCYDDAYWATGVLCNARAMKDDGRLDPWADERVQEIFDWFNTNLPCPNWTMMKASGKWTQDAVSWFKDSSVECIAYARELMEILRVQGHPGRMIRTEKPGEIVYEDEFQIVAEIPKWVKVK